MPFVGAHCGKSARWVLRGGMSTRDHAGSVRALARKRQPQRGSAKATVSRLVPTYPFDVWMQRTFPDTPWCRYADDGLVHCRTEREAQAIMAALDARLGQCGLQMHPGKTKIVYCKDGQRKGKYPNRQFDFLGFNFRPRLVKNSKRHSLFVSFTPAVSKQALKAMRETTRRCNYRNRTELSLADIARLHNPILRGWLQYYGRYCRSAMYPVIRHFNKTLVAWAMRKYKRLHGHKIRASRFLEQLAEKQPHLFVHWQRGMKGGFA